MKKLFRYVTMVLLLAGISLGGCSNNSGGESEKGAIRKMTDQVADDLVHKMRDPIDKARSARDREEDRLSDVAEASEDSSQIE